MNLIPTLLCIVFVSCQLSAQSIFKHSFGTSYGINSIKESRFIYDNFGLNYRFILKNKHRFTAQYTFVRSKFKSESNDIAAAFTSWRWSIGYSHRFLAKRWKMSPILGFDVGQGYSVKKRLEPFNIGDYGESYYPVFGNSVYYYPQVNNEIPPNYVSLFDNFNFIGRIYLMLDYQFKQFSFELAGGIRTTTFAVYGPYHPDFPTEKYKHYYAKQPSFLDVSCGVNYHFNWKKTSTKTGE